MHHYHDLAYLWLARAHVANGDPAAARVAYEEFFERMKRADTKESARREGITIGQEMLAQLLPRIQGVQISAPFGRYQTAIDVTRVLPDRDQADA